METATKRKLTDQELEACEYLNALRESGETNMYGATPYVESEMHVGRTEAKRLLILWMKVFKPDGNYSEVEV